MDSPQPGFIERVLEDLKLIQRDIAAGLPAGTLRAREEDGSERDFDAGPEHAEDHVESRQSFLDNLTDITNDAFERHVHQPSTQPVDVEG